MDNSFISETAKATQETAKAASNIVDKGAEFSRFLERIFGSSFENIGDIAAMHTELWKIKNALKVQDKLNYILKDRDIQIIKPISSRLALPIINQIVNEDEESLQNLWANLLASSMSNNKHTMVTKTSIEIMKNLDVIDAELLDNIFMLNRVNIYKNRSEWIKENAKYDCLQISLALNNLERLGLIEINSIQSKESEKDDKNLSIVFINTNDKNYKQFEVNFSITLFGFFFMRVCTGIKLDSEDGSGEFLPIDERLNFLENPIVYK